MGYEKRELGVSPKVVPIRVRVSESKPEKPAAPRGRDRLTDTDCRNAKPGATLRKLADGKGLYLAILPTGSKVWRAKYRHAEKERVYTIGPYPEVSLARARAAHDEHVRAPLREGADPIKARETRRQQQRELGENTFRAVAERWLATQEYSAKHLMAQRKRLDEALYPALGAMPIDTIEPKHVLAVLRDFESRGTLEMGAKCRRMASQIFRYGAQTGYCKTDPAALLRGAIKAPKVRNRATVKQAELPALFETVGKVRTELTTRLAFWWTILTAARTGEARFATWGEIEGGKLWRIPAERMKADREHVVPLSTQAQTILDLAAPLRASDTDGALLFPGFTRSGALSENAFLALLARAGYFGRQTMHGMRAAFSTWAHETADANPDVIEGCLAHAIAGLRGVYSRASYVAQRRALLQAWADQCETWGMRLPDA